MHWHINVCFLGSCLWKLNWIETSSFKEWLHSHFSFFLSDIKTMDLLSVTGYCLVIYVIMQFVRFIRADADFTLLWAEYLGNKPGNKVNIFLCLLDSLFLHSDVKMYPIHQEKFYFRILHFFQFMIISICLYLHRCILVCCSHYWCWAIKIMNVQVWTHVDVKQCETRTWRFNATWIRL